LKKSREENIKPYFLYNDKQLAEILEKNPKNIEALKTVSGFGDIKCQKYGADILKILKEC
jgi:superfamily II DNA helicase RecQ